MLTFNHTPHIETQIVELAIAFVTTNIVPKTNYKPWEPQNGPTFYEHVTQGSHVILNETQPTFMYMPTCVGRNYFPTLITSPYAQHGFVL
jgi:hypothetical protein